MSRLLLTLGVCLLALTLTTTDASAEAFLAGPPIATSSAAPAGQAGADSGIAAPAPVFWIGNWGHTYIEGVDFPTAFADTQAVFELTERHYFEFYGELTAYAELGESRAGAALFGLTNPTAFIYEAFSTGPTDVMFDAGIGGILDPGIYALLGSAASLADRQTAQGLAKSSFSFHLHLRPVPEPTSMALLASGACALVLLRRRKRRVEA